jgi:hypothetical protein
MPLPPRHYTLANVLAAIDSLEAAGLIEHHKTAPSPTAKYRSRVRASKSQLHRLGLPSAAYFVFTRRELIVLRDKDGDLAEYTDSRRDNLPHEKALAVYPRRMKIVSIWQCARPVPASAGFVFWSDEFRPPN